MTEDISGRRTRRELLAAAAGATAGVTLLSACGGGESTETAAQGLSGEFTFSAWPGGNAEKFFQQRVAAFERAHRAVTVKSDFDVPHEQYSTVLQSQLAANRLPDLFIQDGNAVPNLMAKNAVTPLSELIEGSKVDLGWFPEGFVEGLASKDGTVYALPYYLSPNVLFYRTDMFKEAGVTPPATWEQLIDVAGTLRDKLGLEHPFAFDPVGVFWASDWIFQAGGEIMNGDQTEYTLDSPEVVRALQFIHGLLYREGIVDPTLPKQTNGVLTQWGQGKVAFWQGGGFYLPTLNTQYPKLKGKWAIAPLPGDQREVAVVDGPPLLISANSKAKEAAFALIETMVSPEAGVELMKITDGLPTANLASYDLPAMRDAFPGIGDALKQALATGKVLPASASFQQAYYDVFGKAYARFMAKASADIPAEMAKVNEQANALLAQGA